MSKQEKPVAAYNPTTEQDDRFKTYFDKYENFKESRNQTIDFFYKGDKQRGILEYVKDSVNRMNEKHLKPAYKEDWQNNVFDPVTRNKVIAILARMAATRMKPELMVSPDNIFIGENTERRRTVLEDLLEAANRKNKDAYQLIWEMYTALSEGTVFGFESWKRDSREVEYVKEYDPDTGEKKVETIKVNAWDDVYGEIVPIEEFYPDTIWVNDMSKIYSCFWRKVYSKNQFESRFRNFKNYKNVKVKGSYRKEDGFDWGISSDVDDDKIEVLQYYDVLQDKMGIWANGVELYWGCLPWNHKRLPFWRAIGEPIHHQFLYGKSFPDKVMGMQDIDNGLFNAILDQVFLSLNSPTIIAGHIDDLDDGYLEPGKYYEASPDTKVERVKLGAVDGATFPTLQYVKNSMEESTISAQAQGIPTGGRKTKYEVQALQEGASMVESLFLQLMESAMRDKYLLRIHNIIQYYSMPSRDKEGNPRFKFIVLDKVKLPNKKIGKKMIQIVGTNSDLKQPEELQDMAANLEGRPFDLMESKVQPILITRDWLMKDGFNIEIDIVPNSSTKDSAVTRANKDIAFAQYAKGDPGFNQEMIRRDFAKAFDKPEEVVVSEQDRMAEEQRQLANAQQAQGKGTPGVPGMSGVPAGGGAPIQEDLI